MNDHDWTRIEALLGRVLDAPPAERANLIDRISGDSGLREELHELAGVADDADLYMGAFSSRLRDRMARVRRALGDGRPE